MKNLILPIILGVIAVLVTFGITKQQSTGGLGASNDVPVFARASSTAIVVGNSGSVRILASSTAANYRYHAKIQSTNCATGTYLSFSGDTAATVGEGYLLAASSTLDIDRNFIHRGSVQATTTTGTCRLLINEWVRPLP